MQKQAPSVGRILIAAGFTLSCFGLILFLWTAFGGPIPLRPESYRVTAYFPEATQLAVESDVRIGGVSVGKVKQIELAPPRTRVNGQDTTEAVIEIQPEFAPISTDARAILRQKTLLGETYVELTSGTEPSPEGAPVALGTAANVTDAQSEDVESIPEGGTLGISRTEDATQIDEIFNALDDQTRTAFQRWQQESAVAIDGRGLDLNDTFGNLGPFLTDASDIVDVLGRQKDALKGLVRDTGTVFDALSAQGDALAGAIQGSDNTFDALASEDAALAETFQIMPTFQRETRATLERLDTFQANTKPLIDDLIPVARDLSPTLASVRELSPNLRDLFVKLGDLEVVARTGLPAARSFLDGLRPVLDQLDPFLANLNPILRYLEFQKATVVDFLMAPGRRALGRVRGPARRSGRPPRPAPDRLRRPGGAVDLSAAPCDQPRQRLPGRRARSTASARRRTGSSPTSTAATPTTAPAARRPTRTRSSPARASPESTMGNPPGTTPEQFAPCYIQGDFPGPPGDDFGGGRFPAFSRTRKPILRASPAGSAG